jgi:hypothetical protein
MLCWSRQSNGDENSELSGPGRYRVEWTPDIKGACAGTGKRSMCVGQAAGGRAKVPWDAYGRDAYERQATLSLSPGSTQHAISREHAISGVHSTRYLRGTCYFRGPLNTLSRLVRLPSIGVPSIGVPAHRTDNLLVARSRAIASLQRPDRLFCSTASRLAHTIFCLCPRTRSLSPGSTRHAMTRYRRGPTR